MIHEVPLERRTVHGYFSRDLEPVLTIDPGDSVVTSTLDAGWGLEQFPEDGSTRRRVAERDPELDRGHALVGPIRVRGARAGETLTVRIDEIRVGTFGWNEAGGWSTPLNDRLDVSEREGTRLRWTLDADRNVGRDQYGREVDLRPFLGVVGMPPPEPGIHSTRPPRIWGGNLDCTKTTVGSTIHLPIPLDGALLSFGDGHARQGDGEVSQLAIEAPFERVRVTVDLRPDLSLPGPVVRTADAWVTLGLDEDLVEATALALEAMLELMGREYGLSRTDALALASVVVDLRVTQVVNEVSGVHAVLRDGAVRFP